MVKNKLFANFFLKRDLKKLQKKIIKSKKRWNLLGDKIDKQTINSKEVEEYKKLAESIRKLTMEFNTMKTKYDINMKGGRISLSTKDKTKEVPQEQPVETVQQPTQQPQPVQPMQQQQVQQPVEQVQQVQQPAQVPQQPQQPAQVPQQPQQPQQYQPTQEEIQEAELKEQHRLHLQAEVSRKQQEQLIAAQQQAQLEAQQEVQRQAQHNREVAQHQVEQKQLYNSLSPEQKQEFHRQMEARQAQAQQKQQEQQERQAQEQQQVPLDQLVDITIFVQDMPLLVRRIYRTDMQEFTDELDKIVYDNLKLPVNEFVAYGAHVSGYAFSEAK